MKVPETKKEGEVADISEGWEDDWEVRTSVSREIETLRY